MFVLSAGLIGYPLRHFLMLIAAVKHQVTGGLHKNSSLIIILHNKIMALLPLGMPVLRQLRAVHQPVR